MTDGVQPEAEWRNSVHRLVTAVIGTTPSSYNRAQMASRIVERLEQNGVISAPAPDAIPNRAAKCAGQDRPHEWKPTREKGANRVCVRCGQLDYSTHEERRHATRNRVQEWCREDLPNGERCNKPAEFILWGKLFPKEGLGPRCYDHAAKHAGHRALGPGTVGQYAIYVLPHAIPNRVLTGDCEEDCVDGCAYPGQFSECELGGAGPATRNRVTVEIDRDLALYLAARQSKDWVWDATSKLRRAVQEALGV